MNTTRNRALKAARLLHYQQGLNSPEPLISEALNNAARTYITTRTTRFQLVRLQKGNLAALSNANSELSTFKATTLKDARILILRESVVQEIDARWYRINQTEPSPPRVDEPDLTARKSLRKRKQEPNPNHLYEAATWRVKAATRNLNHLLETQKRLTATKDGPFLDPGSTPTVLALPFVPPSWAAIMTGGYRHHRIRRKFHAKHPPSRKETLTANRANRHKTPRSCAGPHHGPDRPLSGSLHSVLRFIPHPLSRKETRRANHCKTPRSCAGPDPGPGRRPRSGPPHATPSRWSHTPARPYRHNDGYGQRERGDDSRGRPPPPPPPNPPRGDLPHLRIRCHFSDHAGQCERHCRPSNTGHFPFRLVRKHTTLTFCTDVCMEAFLVDEHSTLISQPWPPHYRDSADAFLNRRVLELLSDPCPDNPLR